MDNIGGDNHLTTKVVVVGMWKTVEHCLVHCGGDGGLNVNDGNYYRRLDLHEFVCIPFDITIGQAGANYKFPLILMMSFFPLLL